MQKSKTTTDKRGGASPRLDKRASVSDVLFAASILRKHIQQGGFGDELQAKYAVANHCSAMIDVLHRSIVEGTVMGIRAKIAQHLIDQHDHLESLPTNEAWSKVASSVADTVQKIREDLAAKSLLSPASQHVYPDLYGRARFNESSPITYHIGSLGRLWGDKFLGYPNRPGPLASMLVLGSLGALAGAGLGKSLQFIHKDAFKGVTPRTAVYGALLGMAPGLGYGMFNLLAGNKFNDASLNLPLKRKKTGVFEDAVKLSSAFTTEQVRALLDDPYVYRNVPPMLGAATIGLVEGAQHMSGRRNDIPFVTPGDITRMAVGMGSGYLSGRLVGHALGGLFGVSDSAQKILRQSGMAAGLIKSVVPLAFGGP